MSVFRSNCLDTHMNICPITHLTRYSSEGSLMHCKLLNAKLPKTTSCIHLPLPVKESEGYIIIIHCPLLTMSHFCWTLETCQTLSKLPFQTSEQSCYGANLFDTICLKVRKFLLRMLRF